MAPTLIKQPTSKTEEQWLRVNLGETAGGEGGADLVVVSGYAHYTHGTLKGSDDTDMLAVDYVAEILVGPRWLRLVDVSPIVTVTGYLSWEADEADMMWYQVRGCAWELPEPPDPKRIRLIVSLDVGGGEQASVNTLAYHLVARGMLVPGQDFKENI